MRVKADWPKIPLIVVFLIGLTTFFSVAASAQTSNPALSKDKLLALKDAGVGDPVLIQQIERDGISFDMDADTTLELKAKGVSNEVLQALLKAIPDASSKKTAQGPYAEIAVLYQQNRFADVADKLRVYLKDQPQDAKARAILVLALLKLDESTLAQSEFERLKAFPPSRDVQAYTETISGLMAKLQARKIAKEQIIEALKNYDSKRALELIDGLSASPLQSQILSVYLAMYAADYAKARTIAANFENAATISERQMLKQLESQIGENEKKFAALNKQADGFLYSDLGVSFCNEFEAVPGTQSGVPRNFLADYFSTVQALTQLAPLNGHVMDLVFHSSLILLKAEELQQLGDRILKTKGDLRIPFFSYDTYFNLVIDANARRIYTDPDKTHPFQVKYDYALHGIFGAVATDQQRARWYEPLKPVDLKFEQVSGLSQKAKEWRGGLEDRSIALKFEPTGIAPNYVFMNLVHCIYGQAAQRTATRQLGEFVLHLLDRKDIKVELVDPQKLSHDHWDGIGEAMVGAYGALGAQQGNVGAVTLAGEMSSQLAADDQNRAAYKQAQESAWYQSVAQQVFRFTDADLFTDFEKLLGLLG